MNGSQEDSERSEEEIDEILRAVAAAPPRLPERRENEADGRLGRILLGKYFLHAVLGRGGMATVYAAVHRNRSEYAIKMLLPAHASNPDIVRRFRREGYIANSVRHPGAVSVFDDDVAEDGTAFLVLELLRGASCEELWRAEGRRLPADAVCALGLQVLDVLRAAHAERIIHRDVKPSNLFVLPDGTVKVLDFGIARVRQAIPGGESTQSGTWLGTPAFMAPEQGAGSSAVVDERADLWAVGATMFTLLTGTIAPRPLASADAIPSAVPREVAAVLVRALQFDPAARWPSAVAMRQALARATGAASPDRGVLAAFVAGSQSGLASPKFPDAGGAESAPPPRRPRGDSLTPVAASLVPRSNGEPPGAEISLREYASQAIILAAPSLAVAWLLASP